MEKDGLTCAACLTLNPVGAPACVRCNAPLAGPAESPPQQYAPAPPRYVPPPAAQPQFAPQPGPQQPGPQQPGPQQPGPQQQYVPPPDSPGQSPGGPQLTPLRRRQRRRMLLIGNLVVLVVLAGGAVVLWKTRPHYLDTGVVARTLSDRLGAKVTCPEKARRAAGTRFDCSVVYASDRRGSVTVTVTDSAGNYTWKAGQQHR